MKRVLLLFLLLLSVTAFAQGDTPTAPTPLTATEVTRFPVYSAIFGATTLISPDGEHILNIARDALCLYAFDGTLVRCTNMDDAIGQRLHIDMETPVWSPDGKYVAFALNTLILYVDSDIWVFEVETGALKNLTDDNFDGGLPLNQKDDVDGVFVDLSPAWLPDGRLSFIRHDLDFKLPELWVLDINEGTPEKLGSLVGVPGTTTYIYDSDWSPDGTKLVFNVDSRGHMFAGLWYFDMADNKPHPIVYLPRQNEMFIDVEFSPNGESVLLLTTIREVVNSNRKPDDELGSGYYIVALDTGVLEPVASHGRLLNSAGWMPDGTLLYVAADPNDDTRENSGLFITADAQAEPVRILNYIEINGAQTAFFAPTPRQFRALDITANGRLVLGTPSQVTVMVQVEADE